MTSELYNIRLSLDNTTFQCHSYFCNCRIILKRRLVKESDGERPIPEHENGLGTREGEWVHVDDELTTPASLKRLLDIYWSGNECIRSCINSDSWVSDLQRDKVLRHPLPLVGYPLSGGKRKIWISITLRRFEIISRCPICSQL